MPSTLRSAAMGAPCCPHNRPAKQAHRPSLPNVSKPSDLRKYHHAARLSSALPRGIYDLKRQKKVKNSKGAFCPFFTFPNRECFKVIPKGSLMLYHFANQTLQNRLFHISRLLLTFFNKTYILTKNRPKKTPITYQLRINSVSTPYQLPHFIVVPLHSLFNLSNLEAMSKETIKTIINLVCTVLSAIAAAIAQTACANHVQL